MSVFSQRPFSDRTARWLQQSGLHPLLARLSAARGIDKPDELSLLGGYSKAVFTHY